MRPIHLLLLIASLTLAAAPAQAAGAAEPRSATFVNSRVSHRSIALNQTVRVEFTTMPREVEGIDIASSLANALTVGSSSAWRLMGRPTVTEHGKTKTVSVMFTLLPRASGDQPLPQVQMPWLLGSPTAEFGLIKVASHLQVAGEERDLPAEAAGVAGYAWGAKLAEFRNRFPADAITYAKDVSPIVATVRPQPGLELIFRGGELAEAVLVAPGLTLDQARTSFFDRWGLPQIETDATGERPATISWIVGWTRIDATAAATTAPAPGEPGVRLVLTREDIQARLDKGRVQDGLFGLLDRPIDAAPAGRTPTAAPAEAKANDADAEFRRAAEAARQQPAEPKP